jgi:L-cysteine desulfidase
MHKDRGEAITPSEALKLVYGTVFDSVGCTEPVAIAYAATAAYAHIGGGELKRVECTVSVSVFKNAMAVGIPGSDRSGIDFAVALGILAGDWNKGLELFSNVSPEDIERASETADAGAVSVTLYEGTEKFYIHTLVETERGTAAALIRGSHDALEWVEVDGSRVWETAAAQSSPVGSSGRAETAGRGAAELTEILLRRSPAELIQLADSMPENELQRLTEGVEINLRAAEYGLENGPGMALGRTLMELAREEGCADSVAEQAQHHVAAAVDTRMSGALIPIKGCGGSGNHGITFFLTLGIGYRHGGEKPEKSLARTLAFGLLLVRYLKGYTGLLSPTCGVTVSAAPAAAAALLYARGGTAKEVTAAVKLIEGNLAGILCDGAKQGCALKAATSARTAIETFRLVRKGVRIPSTDGIVGGNMRESMMHLQELQERGLRDADRTMLGILQRKSEKGNGRSE